MLLFIHGGHQLQHYMAELIQIASADVMPYYQVSHSSHIGNKQMAVFITSVTETRAWVYVHY